MRQGNILLIFSFCFLGSVSGQVRENIHFHHLTQSQGLIQYWNWFVFQDSKSNVWISSVSGLTRFDGTSTTAFSASTNTQYGLKGQIIGGAFVESPDADLWFAADNYLCRYDRKSDRFRNYQLLASANKAYNSNYRVLTQDQNGIWLTVEDGRLKNPAYQIPFGIKDSLIEATPVLYLPEETNMHIPLKTRDGKVFGFFNYSYGFNIGIVNFLDTSKIQIPLQLLGRNNGQYDIYDAKWHPEYGLLIATNKGLFLWKTDGSEPRCILRETGLSAVETTDDGRIFLGNANGEVLETRWGAFTEIKRYLPYKDLTIDKSANRSVIRLYFDPNGSLWVTYFDLGVYWTNFSKNKFNILDRNEKTNQITSVLCENTHELWGLTDHALLKLDRNGAEIERMNLPKSLGASCQMKNFKALLLFKEEAFYLYDKQQKKLQFVGTKPGPNSAFMDVCMLPDGNLLAATYAGLYLYQPKGKGYEATVLDILPRDEGYPNLYLDREGLIYVLKDVTELYVLNYQNGKFSLNGAPIPIRAEIKDWSENPHAIWIASNNGLIRMDKKKRQLLHISREVNLPSPLVTNIVCDKSNGVWLISGGKLAYFDGKQMRLFSKADGVPDLAFNQNNNTLDFDQNLWIASQNGLVQSKINATTAYSGDSKILIKQILINEKLDSTLRCALTGSTLPNEIQKIVIPYHNRNLKFDFSAIEYGDPANNYLEYQVINADTNWIQTPNPGFARLIGLQEGAYYLRIRAYNSDGVRGLETRTIQIIIKPPFERSNVFYLLVIVAISFITAGISRFRREQRLLLQAMRQQIADDLHDEVGSSLTGILMFSATLERMIPIKDRESYYMLQRISANAKKTLGSFRDIIWATNPQYDQVKHLVARMRTVVSEINDTGAILCRFSVHMSGYENATLNPQVRHNVFLIFREALNNAVKYSKSPEVKVRLEFLDSQLTLEVSDSGIGFDPQSVSAGNGLYTLKKRAQMLKGHFTFESAPGKGTHLFLRIKLSRLKPIA